MNASAATYLPQKSNGKGLYPTMHIYSILTTHRMLHDGHSGCHRSSKHIQYTFSECDFLMCRTNGVGNITEFRFLLFFSNFFFDLLRVVGKNRSYKPKSLIYPLQFNELKGENFTPIITIFNEIAANINLVESSRKESSDVEKYYSK